MPQPTPDCPMCGRPIPDDDPGERPWGPNGPALHTTCADELRQDEQLRDALKADPTCAICRRPIETAAEAQMWSFPTQRMSGPCHKECATRLLQRAAATITKYGARGFKAVR